MCIYQSVALLVGNFEKTMKEQETNSGILDGREKETSVKYILENRKQHILVKQLTKATSV